MTIVSKYQIQIQVSLIESVTIALHYAALHTLQVPFALAG